MVSKQPPQAPPSFNSPNKSLIETAKFLIERTRKIQNELASSIAPETATFATVLSPLAHAENTLQSVAQLIGFHKEASPDAELRAASRESQKLFDEFTIEMAMREDIYQLVEAVWNKNNNKEHGNDDLDPESQKLLSKVHGSFVRNGLKLPAGPLRDKFKDIQLRISGLKGKFQENQSEESAGIWFSPAELEGVPLDVLAGFDKGSGETAGKVLFAINSPNLMAAYRYAKSSETRKRCFLAWNNSCGKNVPVFRELALLRDEAARILDFPNHATFSLQEKMAKTPRNVNLFLNDLRAKLAVGGQKELDHLKRLKKADLESRGELYDGRLYLWEMEYYKQRMLKKEYSINHQKIAEYFPLQTTVEAMLEIYQHLFGLEFVEITNEKHKEGNFVTWHEDVQMFSAWDDEEQGGKFLGYLYLDLFPRGGKSSYPSAYLLQPGFVCEDGTRHYPASALLCAFTKPTSIKPSLLNHTEVVTMFHELGHAIHDLVSKTKYWIFHGGSTAIDFCEAPSQMLENWCWLPSTLKLLGKHYTTLSSKEPQRIPDKMIEDLVRTKHINGALFQLRVLHFSFYDMLIHEPGSREELENLNFSAKYNQLRKELMLVDGPEVLGQGFEWGHGQSTFHHMIAGYDAGYYSYLYSQVFSDDMFYSVFKEDPMNSTQGLRYRYMVLEKGGSLDEMKVLTTYLGRKPNSDAFHRELGIA